MDETILITGGAGFIGSHLADELLSAGYRVRVLDSLDPQVHGSSNAAAGRRPDYLDARVELHLGDVRDPDAVARALEGVAGVFHFAARVGVGQSMYEVASYVDSNVRGSAVLLEQIERARADGAPVPRLIVASSMSVYGEGPYRTRDGTTVTAERSAAQLRDSRWEVPDADGRPLTPVATPESKTPALASVYALTKMDQERLALLLGDAYGIPVTALRFFNVYGERQALSNPYTGVLAIFASRLLNGKAPVIFEDGHQRRDFIHVRDVARACRLALETPDAAGRSFNIGSGGSISIRQLADALARVMGCGALEPRVTGQFRAGDIRHCFADTTAARSVLGFAPAMELEAGLARFATWLADQQAVDRVDEAHGELRARRLAG